MNTCPAASQMVKAVGEKQVLESSCPKPVWLQPFSDLQLSLGFSDILPVNSCVTQTKQSCFLFRFAVFWPYCSMWALGSLVRDRTRVP